LAGLSRFYFLILINANTPFGFVSVIAARKEFSKAAIFGQAIRHRVDAGSAK
jgi:hypothetical protein